MKKLIFCVFILLALVSCNINENSTVINESTRQISFQWSKNNPSVIILETGQSESIEYSFARVHNLQPAKRVKQIWDDGNIISINDIIPYEIRVENTLSDPVTLEADGWMDAMINIIPGEYIDDDSQRGNVYTNKPKFSVTSYTFPVIVQYQFIDNIFYVKIY
ncbi:MAG: hypothetical protein FWD22_02350 [Treponema sp.]|nr:hypothetical protein [Treponema sp.]